jgi:hypothetical protein
MIVPVPNKMKNYLMQTVLDLSNNQIVKTLVYMTIMSVFGLFIESMIATYRYDAIRLDTVRSGIVNVSNHTDILVKLFRSQRNMYMAFVVNFNWCVMYGMYEYIKRVTNLEERVRIQMHNLASFNDK